MGSPTTAVSYTPEQRWHLAAEAIKAGNPNPDTTNKLISSALVTGTQPTEEFVAAEKEREAHPKDDSQAMAFEAWDRAGAAKDPSVAHALKNIAVIDLKEKVPTLKAVQTDVGLTALDATVNRKLNSTSDPAIIAALKGVHDQISGSYMTPGYSGAEQAGVNKYLGLSGSELNGLQAK